MWTIVKFDKKNIEFLKKELKKTLGEDTIIYTPKFFVESYKKNKLHGKELHLLGDYLFCFNKKLKNHKFLDFLKYTKGLKYFLSGCYEAQEEIENFIKKCKNSENDKGYLVKNFFDICKYSKYKFASGPFAEKIFKIIDLRKNEINILLGNIKTTIRKEKFLFRPV